MKIIIHNRLQQPESRIIENVDVQVAPLLLALVNAPEEKRIKMFSTLSRKARKIPTEAPTLDDVNQTLCIAVTKGTWPIPHIHGRRLGATLKGFSSSWDTIEIDEKSFFKHRKEDPQLIENIIAKYSRPAVSRTPSPEPVKPDFVVRPPTETNPLKIKVDPETETPNPTAYPKKYFLLSSILGVGAGVALTLLGLNWMFIVAGIALTTVSSFVLANRFKPASSAPEQENANPPIKIIPSAEQLHSPPNSMMPPKKPVVFSHPSVNAGSPQGVPSVPNEPAPPRVSKTQKVS